MKNMEAEALNPLVLTVLYHILHAVADGILKTFNHFEHSFRLVMTTIVLGLR